MTSSFPLALGRTIRIGVEAHGGREGGRELRREAGREVDREGRREDESGA